MHRFLVLLLALTALLVPWQSDLSAQTDESPVAVPLTQEITALLSQQSGYWNAGDIDGFMQYYWKSEELTFSSGGTTRRGWKETMRRYRDRYPTPERMGKLTFDELEVRPLGERAALVLGRWSLERAPDPVEGNFTLVLEKTAGRWAIVHDHTSQQLPN